MGILGKDLLDYDRPKTHTKIQFGEKSYWIEDNPTEMQYGEILTFLLNFSVDDYVAVLSDLQQARGAADREQTQKAFLALRQEFMKLPLYRTYISSGNSLEPYLYRGIDEPKNEFMLADAVLADDGAIMNKYLWALEDIQFIQQRYKWFLIELFYAYPAEKKKGQRKKSLAELLLLQNLEPFVSGCSLGKSKQVDAPQVNIQYAMYKIEGMKPQIVEKMYFDRIIDFIYVEFMKGLQKGFVPKRCPNCDRWFLQKPGATYSYCDNLAPTEIYKTCRDIGAAASFSEKVKNNEIWKIHQRAYKKYFARTTKGRMRKSDFEVWAKRAEQLRNDALKDYNKTADSEQQMFIVQSLQYELNKA